MKTLIVLVMLYAASSYASAIPESCSNTNGFEAWSVKTYWTATNAMAYDIEALIRRIEDYGQTEELVKALVKQGKICKVLGHNWRVGRPGESGGFTFTDYHPGVTYRTCKVCDKCESMHLEWK